MPLIFVMLIPVQLGVYTYWELLSAYKVLLTGVWIILSRLPSLNLTSHAVIKNWNAATTVQALGSVTALTSSDKESLANDSSPVSGESSAWLLSTNSK